MPSAGASGVSDGKEVREGSGLGEVMLEALDGLFRGRLRILVLLLLLEVCDSCDEDRSRAAAANSAISKIVCSRDDESEMKNFPVKQK